MCVVRETQPTGTPSSRTAKRTGESSHFRPKAVDLLLLNINTDLQGKTNLLQGATFHPRMTKCSLRCLWSFVSLNQVI